MKILFSNPPWWEQPAGTNQLRMGIRAGSRWPFTRPASHLPDAFAFGGYLPKPFFLEYAAGFTQAALPFSEVYMRDSITLGESYSGFLMGLHLIRPDWVIIETSTPSWEHDARVLRLIHHELPSAKVILCGTIDSSRHPVAFKAHPNLVAILQGEPDKQVVKVIAGGMRGTIPHDLLTLEEMNGAALPMEDTRCFRHYWDGCPIGHCPPQLQLWTSRGCPFRCCFCVWPATMTGNDPDGTKPRKVRAYSADYVTRLLADRLFTAKEAGHPYASIYVDDDTFNLTEAHTLAMCEVLSRTGLPWSAMCRADTISDQAWRTMFEAGCFGVKIGFESGSQRVIDTIINKKLNLAKAAATARRLIAMGMSVHGTFTVGLPGETNEERQQTLRFIAELYETHALTTHQLSGTSEIEGTPLHTISTKGKLAKYAGAITDSTYLPSSDGQSKIEQMQRLGQL